MMRFMVRSKYVTYICCALICLVLSGCMVGPNYHRPSIPVPAAYKEVHAKDWCVAKPADLFHRGQWWKIFHNKQLNVLEAQLNINNQNIAVADAQYQQARALVDEARAAYFPTLAASASLIFSQVAGSSGSTGSGSSGNSSSTSSGSGGGGSGSFSNATTTYSFGLNASWEPDIWGAVGRAVEASVAGAQASKAQLAAMRLSMQGSLAQDYYELRGVDSDKKLLDQTVHDDKKALQLTLNRFHQGVGSMVDVVQSRSQLETAQAQAINLGITRGQFEHAIAVLIGEAPADLTIKFHPFFGSPPTIPPQFPSRLLERRPDIAAAERNMAQANAQIGVAIAAYFPAFTFTPTGLIQGINNFFTAPLYSWSFGPQLAETILDGGLRAATVAAARANYHATVAQYRQTVLAAFQDVEDNLVAVHVLKKEYIVRYKAAKDAKLALQLVLNQYKAGTVAYTDVLVSQINAYNAEKAAVDVTTLRMTFTVGLIKALGGGWNARATAAFRPTE